MTYVIGPTCVDEVNGSCVDVCPVDCIYEGERRRYIQPVECIECGACVPACPVDAITNVRDAAPEWIDDNAAFFDTVLPGRAAPLGEPGGASSVGKIGVDTQLTATMPTTTGS